MLGQHREILVSLAVVGSERATILDMDSIRPVRYSEFWRPFIVSPTLWREYVLACRRLVQANLLSITYRMWWSKLCSHTKTAR